MKTIIKLLLFCFPLTGASQNYQIFIDFDTSNAGVFIDTNLTSNVWQIGAPQKIYFTSALTLPNAIVTDTINAYTTNNYSAFYITIPNVYWSGVHLQFKHKYDTDSLMDGGKIEVSSDRLNWTNLIHGNFYLFAPATFGFYTTQNNVSSMNDFGFSGKSNGWQFSQCGWNYPKVDTLYLRFVFSSDSNQTNKDGWMIDSIRIWTDMGIGIDEVGNKNSFGAFPNPVTRKTHLQIPEQYGKVISVDIFSAFGQLVMTTNTQPEIDLFILETGLYFIVATNSKGEKLTTRVLKE